MRPFKRRLLLPWLLASAAACALDAPLGEHTQAVAPPELATWVAEHQVPLVAARAAATR